MKNKIIIGSLVLLGIGFLVWWGGYRGSTQSATLATGVTNATVSASIPEYDFGSVSMVKGNVEHEFAIKNTTDSDLTITSAETSCMCTRAVLKLPDGKELGPFGMPGHGFSPSVNAAIRPGETVSVRAIFDPAAHGPAGVGRVERVVTIATNKGPLTMQFRAQVTP